MAAKSASSVFRLALVQMAVGSNKVENINKAQKLIREAAKKGAKMVVLPECFNCPYGTQYFKEYSEKIPGETTSKLSEVAKELEIYLIGGSLPEEDDGKYYNTCTVYDPTGSMIAKHRKVHLFDVDIPGRIRFQESEVLKSGNSLTTFDTPFCKVGVGICYDIRFAEMAQIYANAGCKLLVYPGAFNMTSGPAHWDILCKARFMLLLCHQRDEQASYVAWGHSRVASPWSEIIAKADHHEHVIFADIDLQYLDEIRQQIPLNTQRRNDIYLVPKVKVEVQKRLSGSCM